MSAPTYYDVMPSPLGALTLTADDEALTGVFFAEDERLHETTSWIRDDRRLAFARAQLEEYFAGERTRFVLPLRPSGTSFQRRVWQALTELAYGETVSYGALARRIGQPTAMRAVGAANGRNPIAVIIPCHRVIGADGSLTGYGGGMQRKRWLLDLERARLGGADLFSSARTSDAASHALAMPG